MTKLHDNAGATPRRFGLRRGTARGFTLLEILTTIIVLSIAMLGVMSLQVVTIRTNEHGGKLSNAVNIALSKLAEIRALQFYLDVTTDPPVLYQDPNLVSSNTVVLDSLGHSPGQTSVNANPPYFSMTWSVTDIPDPIRPGASKNVHIVVTWTDPGDPAGGRFELRDIVMTARYQD